MPNQILFPTLHNLDANCLYIYIYVVSIFLELLENPVGAFFFFFFGREQIVSSLPNVIFPIKQVLVIFPSKVSSIPNVGIPPNYASRMSYKVTSFTIIEPMVFISFFFAN
jgi:hypothetical protein